MKRILLFLLSLTVLLTSCARKMKVATQTVEFSSEDGVLLKGVLYAPLSQDKLPGVILAHMNHGNKNDWKGYARKLVQKGFIVLAFDFRGCGDSQGELEAQKLPLDINSAVNYLANMGRVNRYRIGVVGASMGGMAAVIAAANSSQIKSVVTISSPPTWMGLDPVNYVGKVSPRPILVITGATDPILSLRAAKMLFLAAQDPKEWLQIHTDSHGTDIFKSKMAEELENNISSFLIKTLEPISLTIN